MKHKQQPYLTSTKQRGEGEASILILIAILTVGIWLLISIFFDKLSLQEVQKLEQKCLEYQGTPEYVRFPSGAVKKVLCRKDANVYEKF